jgi:hypothetical protein
LSSILKALKKAEEQSPKLDVPSDVLKKVDTKEALSRRAKHSRTHHRVALTALVLILAGVGTWFVFFSNEPFRILQGKGEAVRPALPGKAVSPATVATTPAPAPGVARDKIPSAADSEPEPRQEKAASIAAPAPEAERQESASKTPAPETQREKGAEPRRVKEPQAFMPEPGRAERQEMEPPKVDRRAAVPPPPPPSRAPQDNSEASQYKLEAIVWAESEQSRFAVINGQILRSGGSIGGLSVLSVGRDYVSVRSNGRDWELRFTMD